MDIVVIFNGIGNQMSQYAYYLAKKELNPNVKVMFDISSRKNHNGYDLERAFGIIIERSLGSVILQNLFRLISRFPLLRIFLRAFGIRTIYEPRNYDYTPSLLEKGPWGINFYWGGWHSERYFLSIEKKIRSTFSFQKSDDKDFVNWLERIQSVPNSVSLHIRRGDYLNIKKDDFWQLNGVATIDYFNKAIACIKEHVKSPQFFVFSDDLQWCKEQFGEEGYYYVDCNSGINSWRDMYLMSECRHHINSNSTFSWWGAWLCKYEDSIIVCPDRFIRNVETKDFYPVSWYKITI